MTDLAATTAAYAAEAHRAVDYLASRFGTEAQRVATAARLGYVATPAPGHQRFTGRLAIPYDTTTDPIDCRFRCIIPDCAHDGHGKYSAAAGAGAHLYNARAILTPQTSIAIAEGEIDAITMQHCVGVPTVGVPGAEAWIPDSPTARAWARLFVDFENVYVIGDGDEAGERFAVTVAATIPGGQACILPEGHDVNSLWLESGPRALTEWIGYSDTKVT